MTVVLIGKKIMKGRFDRIVRMCKKTYASRIKFLVKKLGPT